MSHLDEGLFHAALDGELTEAERASMDAHLAECAPCRARFEEAVSYHDTARGLIVALDPVPTRTSSAEVKTTSIEAARRRRRPWPLLVAWAATVVGAVGLGYRLGGRDVSLGDVATMPAADLAPTATKEAANDEAKLADKVPSPVAPPAETRESFARQNSRAKDGAVGTESDRRAARSELALADSEPAPPLTARSDAAPSPDTVAVTGGVAAEPASPRPAPARFRAAQAAGARAANSAAAAEEPGGAASRPLARDLLKLDGPASPNPADQRRREISAVAAIAALGGSMRLVDGLVPSRFELQGDMVRVVYRTAHGPLVLEQWRAGELLAHELIAPPTAPTDSVQAWEKRIR